MLMCLLWCMCVCFTFLLTSSLRNHSEHQRHVSTDQELFSSWLQTFNKKPWFGIVFRIPTNPAQHEENRKYLSLVCYVWYWWCKNVGLKTFLPLYNWCGLVEIVEVSQQKRPRALSLLQLPGSHDLGWAKLVSVGLLCSRDLVSQNFCQISLAP